MLTKINFNTGIFIITLDFELYWGVRDKRSLKSYQENILGVRKVVPKLLSFFKDYGIHATWATVGFLFYDQKNELLKEIPQCKPNYVNGLFSPYFYIQQIGRNEQEDPCHFGVSLIRKIQNTPFQEIGTHTFSHYFCLEKGQNIESFEADLTSAQHAAQKFGIALKTLVFPRNQFNKEYIQIAEKIGITAYRGNEKNRIYRASDNIDYQSKFRKALRFIDAYINISGHNAYSLDEMNSSLPYNLPSSRFLRPFNSKLRWFERLKLKRIFKDLTFAAKNNLVYHLWWHPHNFGVNIVENLFLLRKILDHFITLNEKYGMKSLNMKEVAKKLNEIIL